MKFFRYFILAVGLILSGLTSYAQSNFEALIRENPQRAAGVIHSYEYIPSTDTPAPGGYEAFYVSHYGRHGSRRATGDGVGSIFQLLGASHEAGILTAEGEVLYETVAAIKKGAEPLVKLYYNEAETLINGLEPVQGPFYRWSDLKAHLERRIAQFTF